MINGSEVESFLINKTTGLSETRIDALSKDINRMGASSPHDVVEYIQRRIRKIVNNYEKQRSKRWFQGPKQKNHTVSKAI